MNIDSLIRDVVARKTAEGLTIDEAASIAGVNRHWLAKFVQGEIKNPTFANLSAVQDFIGGRHAKKRKAPASNESVERAA